MSHSCDNERSKLIIACHDNFGFETGIKRRHKLLNEGHADFYDWLPVLFGFRRCNITFEFKCK